MSKTKNLVVWFNDHPSKNGVAREMGVCACDTDTTEKDCTRDCANILFMFGKEGHGIQVLAGKGTGQKLKLTKREVIVHATRVDVQHTLNKFYGKKED